MNIFFNLFISLAHFILTFCVFSIALCSNDIKTLFILLILLTCVKFSHFFVGRCILTLYENHDTFPPMIELFSNTLTTNLDNKRAEEIIINIGILIVLTKLSILIFFKKFFK